MSTLLSGIPTASLEPSGENQALEALLANPITEELIGFSAKKSHMQTLCSSPTSTLAIPRTRPSRVMPNDPFLKGPDLRKTFWRVVSSQKLTSCSVCATKYLRSREDLTPSKYP